MPNDVYNEIKPLECLDSMVEYYQSIYRSIRHLLGGKGFERETELSRMSRDQVRTLRRYINADLANYGLEFYLQRREWAAHCRSQRTTPTHQDAARTNPAGHPCQMIAGFRAIVDDGNYTYEQFLGDTLPMFIAIHVHLVSINRALGDLYYYVTELPLASFTPAGKREIRNLTAELHRIMGGLLVATHLQPQDDRQYDLVNYLMSCRADCQRFFETIPRYYQTHRMRLVVFQIEPASQETDPYQRRHPLTCLPWSAGVYLDFLAAYENIARHTMAVIHWAIRLYSRWFFVPRRYLQIIAPTLRV